MPSVPPDKHKQAYQQKHHKQRCHQHQDQVPATPVPIAALRLAFHGELLLKRQSYCADSDRMKHEGPRHSPKGLL